MSPQLVDDTVAGEKSRPRGHLLHASFACERQRRQRGEEEGGGRRVLGGWGHRTLALWRERRGGRRERFLGLFLYGHVGLVIQKFTSSFTV